MVLARVAEWFLSSPPPQFVDDRQSKFLGLVRDGRIEQKNIVVDEEEDEYREGRPPYVHVSSIAVAGQLRTKLNSNGGLPRPC